MNRYLLLFIGALGTAMLFFNTSLQAQQLDPKNKIIAQYDSLNKFQPKEKLYVQLDKAVYTSQDTIWFKAYLLDESLITSAQLSGLIYVEMIDFNGDLVKRVALPTKNGITWGGIAIQANYQPGNYTFRAYTNWMQNFGEKYFFKKQLKIVGLSTDVVSSKERVNRLIVTKTAPQSYLKGNQKFDVQFLPEGGSWIAGVTQKMAFKAIKANGKGVEIAGEVVDSKKNTILQFKSNAQGMGYFKLQPKAEEEYTVVFKNPAELKSQVLPKAQPRGIALQLENSFQSDSLHIIIHNTLPNKALYIVGQSRGTLSFVSHINANVPVKNIKIGKDIFPSGLNQLILLDENKQPISERSFFINHRNQLQMAITTNQDVYANRDSIPLHLKVTDNDGKPIIGTFSMAVTDDGQVEKDPLNDGHILSYLLLSSDLKGEVENPGQYFSQANQANHEALEALVLTQGWTSYYNQPLKVKNFKAEKDLTITGKVDNILRKPVAKANVSLFGRNKRTMFLQTVSNEKGEFVFDKLPLLDSASFIVQALNSRDRKGTLGIELNEFKGAEISPVPQIKEDDGKAMADTVISNMVLMQQKAYINADGGVMLKEINVTGKKGIKDSKNLNENGEADLTLTAADLANMPKKTVYQVLTEKVAGFRVTSKGSSTSRDFFVNGSLTKFLIDGVYVDLFYTPAGFGDDDYYLYIKGLLDSYNAEDIKGIEVMISSGNNAAYEYRYTGPPSQIQYCFIEITTKSGSGPNIKKSANTYLYKPMDYGDAKVFYSPRYTVENKTSLKNDLRSTLYWIPNLATNEKGVSNNAFFSSDKKGTYTVWVEGTDLQGNFGFQTLKIKIK